MPNQASKEGKRIHILARDSCINIANSQIHRFSSASLSARRNQNANLSSTIDSCSLTEDMANVGGPTMLKRTLGMQNDRYSQYIGHTTDFEPSLLNVSSGDPHEESLLSRGTLRKVSANDTFLLLPDNETQGYEHAVLDVEAVESLVSPHGRKLIDLYFSTVHPAFPILQKYIFIEKYERDFRELPAPLLAAVYIMAINWWHHSQELSQFPPPDVKELEGLAQTSLSDAMCRPKLSTIEAALVLSQRPGGEKWASTAHLVAVAQEVGLHLDCSDWKIPPWEKGIRRRLAWCLYMQDKWSSLVHGRPSHLFDANWAVKSLSIHDFPDVDWNEGNVEEKEDIEEGRLVFMRFLKLTEILSEILDTFYSLKAMRTAESTDVQGVQMILSQAKPIQLKLKDWYSGLPASIRLESLSSGGRVPKRPSCVGYLHLAYFAAEITLHRRIIRALSSTPSVADAYVHHICRSAAKARLISSMDFVNRLTPNHLRSFWYFASKTNFALIGTFGSLLWATAPGREEADWYKRRLSEYRWTLSVSAKPGEGQYLTEFARDMLDTSTGLLKKLPEKPSLSRSGSAADFSINSVPGSFSGMGSMLGSFSNLASGDLSSAQSDDESSDEDDLHERFAMPM